MTSHIRQEAGVGVFTGFGVTEDEEAVYRRLLAHPDETASGVARALGLASAGELLERLEERGIVTAHDQGFRALPPEVAVEHLILQQQEVAERARAAAIRLAVEERAVVGVGDADAIEVVRGPRARQHAFASLQHAARREVRILDRPPYSVAPLPPSNEIERVRLNEGISYRVIYDPMGLSPERLDGLSAFTALGERARVLPDLPVKAAISDDREALVLPLDETGEAVVVRTPALVQSVAALFEHLWERAMPLRSQRPSDGPPDERDRQVLSLLALGQKDDAIARDLGVARRTIERRVGAMIRATGGRNRFQLGLEAERRGWLAGGEPRS